MRFSVAHVSLDLLTNIGYVAVAVYTSRSQAHARMTSERHDDRHHEYLTLYAIHDRFGNSPNL